VDNWRELKMRGEEGEFNFEWILAGAGMVGIKQRKRNVLYFLLTAEKSR
jgi:hypothetical protein